MINPAPDSSPENTPTDANEKFLHWYCVYTKPSVERYAAMQLRRQKFSVFLPFIKVKRVYHHKLQWRTLPMFGRYLFVRIPNWDLYPALRSTLGVAGIVAFGNTPTRVPGEVIGEIQRRCTNDVLIINTDEYTRGEIVEVVSGPYQGMKAIFDRNTSNAQRVMILLEIMDTAAQVEIERNAIMKEGRNKNVVY